MVRGRRTLTAASTPPGIWLEFRGYLVGLALLIALFATAGLLAR